VSGGGPVTVKGAGRTKTSIKQNANDRIFDLNLTSSNLTLQGLTLTNGDVTNFTIAEARGGAVRAINGKLTLNRVGVLSGDAFAGGGVYAANSARLTIKSSLLESNDAAHGGAINTINNAKATIKRTSFLANDAGSTVSDAQGGAIDNGGTGGMTIVDSSIQGSGATTTGAGTFTAGGGIRSSAPLTVRGSVVSGNTTSSGVDNQSEHGAGIYVGGGEAKIVNSTLFDNDAGVGGDNDGRGGGLYVNAGDAAVRFTTFSGNSASNTGDSIARAGGTAMVGTSIIDSDDDPCDGTVISSGFNVAEFDDPSCAFLDSDVAQADSIDFTGGLTDNGGSTETVAIAQTSLARNLIAKADCKSAKGTDQRGFARPKGTKCDAGAYEFGAKP
jgi:hypothetical protein